MPLADCHCDDLGGTCGYCLRNAPPWFNTPSAGAFQRASALADRDAHEKKRREAACLK